MHGGIAARIHDARHRHQAVTLLPVYNGDAFPDHILRTVHLLHPRRIDRRGIVYIEDPACPVNDFICALRADGDFVIQEDDLPRLHVLIEVVVVQNKLLEHTVIDGDLIVRLGKFPRKQRKAKFAQVCLGENAVAGIGAGRHIGKRIVNIRLRRVLLKILLEVR